MNISEYILKDITPLSPENTVERLISACIEAPVSHVHIVENAMLLGSISESDIQTLDPEGGMVKDHFDLMDLFFAKEDTGILDLLALFAQHETNTLPVITEDRLYVGYYDISDILSLFADTLFMHHEGVVLELQKPKKDFSMNEAAQIVESNQAKLLGMFIQQETVDAVLLSVKIATDDINAIIQTFRRYNYQVLSQHKEDSYLKDLKDRSEYLQKYLNM